MQSGTAYRYGYQGQYSELDKETGWNNFDLRMYDAAIGRWMSTDPYAQFYSPYVGMGNNPVSSVDPDGGFSKVDPEEQTFPGNDGKSLKQIDVVGHTMNALERATSREIFGRK